jgi:predicted branched-subunit amino acid permease
MKVVFNKKDKIVDKHINYLKIGVISYLAWLLHTYLVIVMLTGIYAPVFWEEGTQLSFVMLGVFLGLCIGVFVSTTKKLMDDE